MTGQFFAVYKDIGSGFAEGYEGGIRLKAFHERHLKGKRAAFFDMDGVLEHADLARTYCILLDPRNGAAKFDEISNAVLVPAADGRCPYGFTLVVMAEAIGYLDPKLMKAIGRHVGLTPGAKELIGHAKGRFEHVVAATCAYEDSAKEICRRVGIDDVISIRVKGYSPFSGIDTFTGGTGKRDSVLTLLRCLDLSDDEAIVVGDSWTDVDNVTHFREHLSIMFNPKYPPLANLATVNVYGDDLRCLVPFIDAEFPGNPILFPELAVFNGEGKPGEMVDRECKAGKAMKEGIIRSIEAERPEAEVIRAIREEAGIRPEGEMDMSGIDVWKHVERAIDKHLK
jgi:phosphoserine phosphatase